MAELEDSFFAGMNYIKEIEAIDHDFHLLEGYLREINPIVENPNALAAFMEATMPYSRSRVDKNYRECRKLIAKFCPYNPSLKDTLKQAKKRFDSIYKKLDDFLKEKEKNDR